MTTFEIVDRALTEWIEWANGRWMDRVVVSSVVLLGNQ